MSAHQLNLSAIGKKVGVTEGNLIAAAALGRPLELWTSDQSEICVEKRCQPRSGTVRPLRFVPR